MPQAQGARTVTTADTSHDTRLARLESLVDRLVDEWRIEREQIRDEIRGLRRDYLSGRGVNWAAVSVLMTAGALAAALVWTLISGNRDEIQHHRGLGGHPEALMAITGLGERMDRAFAGIIANDERVVGIEEKVEHQIERIENRLDATAGDRWHRADGLLSREQISALRERVAALEERHAPAHP